MGYSNVSTLTCRLCSVMYLYSKHTNQQTAGTLSARNLSKPKIHSCMFSAVESTVPLCTNTAVKAIHVVYMYSEKRHSQVQKLFS